MSDESAHGARRSFGGFHVDVNSSLPTIADMVVKHAAEQPHAEALVSEGERLTWACFCDRTARIANALLEKGILPNDRVAIVTSPLLGAIEAYVGIVRMGACAVPLPTMVPEAGLAGMLRDSEARFVFASESHRWIVDSALEGGSLIGPDARVGLDFEQLGWVGCGRFIERVSSNLIVGPIPLEADFNIIYSSGTTGTPKGIVHSHRVRAYQASGMLSTYGDRRVALISTPFYSNLSLWGVLTALWAGASIVLLPKFNARDCVEVIERERPSHAFVVPLQLQRLLAEPRFASVVSSLSTFKVCSGSALSPALKQGVVETWPGGLFEVYGMTEGAPTTFMLAEENMDRLASVGKPAVGASIKIIDESGNDLPPRQIGEIVGKTNTMMDGYNRLPAESKALLWFDKNGDRYFRSGDLGYLDEDGFLYVTDRCKDMILSGSSNIYPSDIEAILTQHNSIAEAAVVGIPHSEWGETPYAVVVLKPGHVADPPELLAWSQAHLGRLQRLAGLECRGELPRNGLGKVLKGDLRQQLCARGLPAPRSVGRSDGVPHAIE